ncbi:putative microtubule-associated protein Gb4, partial [Trypanosoma theileri]
MYNNNNSNNNTMPSIEKRSGASSPYASKDGKRRFTRNAETLSPFPDGFLLAKERQPCTPNPSLIRTPNYRLSNPPPSRRIRPESSPDEGPGGLSRALISPRTLAIVNSYTNEPLTVNTIRTNHNVSDTFYNNSNISHTNELGYWTALYLSRDGTRMGKSKVMPPRGKAPHTFENIVSTIQGNAHLLGFKVLYITYLDKDFDTYALLTPQNTVNCTDSFHVVVESKDSRSDENDIQVYPNTSSIMSTMREKEEISENNETVLSLLNGITDKLQSDVSTVSSRGLSSPGGGFFRQANLPLPNQEQRRFKTIQDIERKRREILLANEAESKDLVQKEEKERNDICVDEGSYRINIKAMELRHKFMVRKRIGTGMQIEVGKTTLPSQLVTTTSKNELKKDLTLPPVVEQSSLSVVLDGSALCPLLREHRNRLYSVFERDVSCCLNIPRSNITAQHSISGTPEVRLNVVHDGTRSNSEIRKMIASYNFPNVVDLHGVVHRQPSGYPSILCTPQPMLSTISSSTSLRNTIGDKYETLLIQNKPELEAEEAQLPACRDLDPQSSWRVRVSTSPDRSSIQERSQLASINSTTWDSQRQHSRKQTPEPSVPRNDNKLISFKGEVTLDKESFASLRGHTPIRIPLLKKRIPVSTTSEKDKLILPGKQQQQQYSTPKDYSNRTILPQNVEGSKDNKKSESVQRSQAKNNSVLTPSRGTYAYIRNQLDSINRTLSDLQEAEKQKQPLENIKPTEKEKQDYNSNKTSSTKEGTTTDRKRSNPAFTISTPILQAPNISSAAPMSQNLGQKKNNYQLNTPTQALSDAEHLKDAQKLYQYKETVTPTSENEVHLNNKNIETNPTKEKHEKQITEKLSLPSRQDTTNLHDSTKPETKSDTKSGKAKPLTQIIAEEAEDPILPVESTVDTAAPKELEDAVASAAEEPLTQITSEEARAPSVPAETTVDTAATKELEDAVPSAAVEPLTQITSEEARAPSVPAETTVDTAAPKPLEGSVASAAVEPLTQITAEEARAPSVPAETTVDTAAMKELEDAVASAAVEPLTQITSEEARAPSVPAESTVDTAATKELEDAVASAVVEPLTQITSEEARAPSVPAETTVDTAATKEL